MEYVVHGIVLLESPIEGGYQKSWFVGSLCLLYTTYYIPNIIYSIPYTLYISTHHIRMLRFMLVWGHLNWRSLTSVPQQPRRGSMTPRRTQSSTCFGTRWPFKERRGYIRYKTHKAITVIIMMIARVIITTTIVPQNDSKLWYNYGANVMRSAGPSGPRWPLKSFFWPIPVIPVTCL